MVALCWAAHVWSLGASPRGYVDLVALWHGADRVVVLHDSGARLWGVWLAEVAVQVCVRWGTGGPATACRCGGATGRRWPSALQRPWGRPSGCGAAAACPESMRVMAAAAACPPLRWHWVKRLASARLLALDRRSALRALMRSTLREAPEAWAAVAPWRFVHAARNAGWGHAAVADLLSRAHRPVGLVGAVRRSLQLAGVMELGDHVNTRTLGSRNGPDGRARKRTSMSGNTPKAGLSPEEILEPHRPRPRQHRFGRAAPSSSATAGQSQLNPTSLATCIDGANGKQTPDNTSNS